MATIKAEEEEDDKMATIKTGEEEECNNGYNGWSGEEDKNGQSILLDTHQGLATWVFVEIDFTEVISSCHQLFNIMRAATSIYVCAIGAIRPNT